MLEKLSDRICSNPFDEQKEVIEKAKKRMQKALIHTAIAQDAACFTYIFIEPEIINSSSDKKTTSACTV